MSIDSAALAALTQAVAHSVTQSVGNSIDKKMDTIRNDLDQFNVAQAEKLGTTLTKGMEEIFTCLTKRQDTYEASSEQRFKNLEAKQEDIDQKNEERILGIEKQISCLTEAITQRNLFPPLPPVSAPQSLPCQPPHPYELPLPMFAKVSQTDSNQLPNVSPNDLKAIADIVSNARTIIGLGPISSSHIEETEGSSPDNKLFLAAVDFLRNELGVKEDEIKQDDIIKVFQADDPNLQRAYVQFSTKEQAELCLTLTRRLRKPELKVVLYIPEQFKLRFLTLKNEDYRLRKLTIPRHKTRIEYSDDDLILLACPIGHFRFVEHQVHGLPAVDLAPARTPPPGRKSKRTRSDSLSPNVEKKKERFESPKSTDKTGPADPALTTEEDQSEGKNLN